MVSVDPIRDRNIYNKIKHDLKEWNEKYYIMFLIGSLLALRINEILSLRVGDVAGKKEHTFRQSKTGKEITIAFNSELTAALKTYCAGKDPQEALIPCRDNEYKPLSDKHAKAEWKRIFPLLEKNGLVTDADYMALCAYCQNVDTWICAEKQKRVEGITTTTSNGCEIQHPAVGIANTAMTNMLKFGREFGLTPSSRSDLSAEKFENADNPLLSLMKRAGHS